MFYPVYGWWRIVDTVWITPAPRPMFGDKWYCVSSGLAVDTVVVPKGQAIPDHTVSILSSGTSAAEASAVAVGTVRVASATGIGRLFLRDIRVPGAVAARRCGCWLQPVQPIPTENPLSRPACHPGQPSAAEPPFDPLWCHLVQPGARFGHLPSPRALAGRMDPPGPVPRSCRE